MGPTQHWQFNDTGVFELPVDGNIWTGASGNTSIIARSVTDSSYVELATQDNSDIKRSNVKVTRDNVTVTTSSGAYNWAFDVNGKDRKSTRLNSSHSQQSRMPSSA